MHHWSTRTALLLLSSLIALAACSGVDEEDASAQIRERFCARWPYGCSAETQIVVKRVRKAGEGRLVDFRIVDGSTKTDVLSAAYFEEQETGWEFFSFDDPFREIFENQANSMNADRKRLDDLLLDLKAKQNWYRAIYGRYAASFQELASRVRYSASYEQVAMTVDPEGESFEASAVGQYFTCEFDTSRRLPNCQLNAQGTETDPLGLSAAFGAD